MYTPKQPIPNFMTTTIKKETALTQAQLGIWKGQQLNIHSPQYNAADAIEILSELNLSKFEKAVLQVLKESTAFNIRFEETSKRVQQYKNSTEIDLNKLDLSMEDAPRVAAIAWMKQDLKTVVALNKDALTKQCLIKIANNHYIWYYRIHHIACDGYGFSLFRQHVSDIYNALINDTLQTQNRIKPLGDYSRLLVEDEKYQNSNKIKSDREFWLNHLKGMQNPVSLSKLNAPVQDESISESFIIGSDKFSGLTELARGFNCNWSDIILSLTYSVIYNANAQNEITIGLPVMNRMGSPLLRIPGMVMNIIPLQLNMANCVTFSDVVKKVITLLKETRPHQKYRYEQLRRDLKIVGGDKRLYGPVVNIMPFENRLYFGNSKAIIHNLSAGPVEDISFSFIQEHNKLVFKLEANPARYNRNSLVEIQKHFSKALSKALVQPSYKLISDSKQFSWLTGNELVLPHKSFSNFLMEKMQVSPNKTALVYKGKETSYKQFFNRCCKLASAFVKNGIKPEKPVALALKRGEEAVLSNMALLFMGTPYLFLDPDGPEERNKNIIADLNPQIIIHQKEGVLGFNTKTIQFKELEEESHRLEPFTHFECNDSLPAYFIYTSGTTGKPKGIKISRKAIFEFTLAAVQDYGISQNDRILQFAPMHFDTSVEELFLSFGTASTLCIRDEEMINSVPDFILECKKLRITVLDLPTAYWHELVYYCSNTAVKIPQCIRKVIIGGEAAIEERVNQWHKLANVNIQLLNTYGPSETTVVATFANLIPEEKLSIGKPLSGRQIAVVDKHNTILPLGEEGELIIAGAGLGDEYLNLPKQTKERFIQLYLPWTNKSIRAYKSGDRVKLSKSGSIIFLGRIDNEIKISGQRINPQEIENAIIAIKQVKEAAVITTESSEAQKRLVAYISLNEFIDTELIRDQLSLILPKPMIPTLHIHEGNLPKNQAGKIDRIRLKLGFDNKFDSAIESNQLSSVEQTIAAIWKDILGITIVNSEDDFFMLGGESLQTIQVAVRLSAAFNKDVPNNMLFKYPTLQSLAQQFSQHEVKTNTSTSVLSDCKQLAMALPKNKIQVNIKPKCINAKPVLLTGSTGFIGAHLLKELLSTTDYKVICLIRASDNLAAHHKIKNACEKQNLNIDEYWDRIELLLGDIEKEKLGLSITAFSDLSNKIEKIIHNAAVISIVRNYQSMRAANVVAVQELLKLMVNKPISFHYVSTIAVGKGNLSEEYINWHDGLIDGYQQSKWAAEYLVKTASERGYNVCTYRLARVIGDINLGFVNRSDLVWSIIRSSVRLGYYPTIKISEPWTPVNVVAKAIVKGVSNANSDNKVYNLTPTHTVELSNLFSWVKEFGFAMEEVTMEDWLLNLSQSDNSEDQALLAFFQKQKGGKKVKSSEIDNSNTNADLLKDGLTFPKITKEIFSKYVRYAICNIILMTKSLI